MNTTTNGASLSLSRDLFRRIDSDRSGGVSTTELQKLTAAITESGGTTIDTESLSTYDQDGNGSLSGPELRTLLDGNGFGATMDLPGLAPPLATAQQATAAYAAQASDAPPADIFGKVDTDRSGSLSRSELQTLAAQLKQTTGQTLDVSDDAFAVYDSNGDGVLTPDELDLLKALSLKQNDGGGDSTSSELMATLDQNWYQMQSASANEMA